MQNIFGICRKYVENPAFRPLAATFPYPHNYLIV